MGFTPDPRSLLPAIDVSMVLVRPPATKKERRQWRRALESFRIVVTADGMGSLMDVTAYDIYLMTLLKWSPAEPQQSPPPAL